METTPRKHLCECRKCGKSAHVELRNHPQNASWRGYCELSDIEAIGLMPLNTLLGSDTVMVEILTFICNDCFEDSDEYVRVADTIAHVDETVMDGNGERQYIEDCCCCIDCQEYYHSGNHWHETINGETVCESCRDHGDWCYTQDSECYVVHCDNVYSCPECSEVWAYETNAMECCGCGRGDWHCYSANVLSELGNYYVDINQIHGAGRFKLRDKPRHMLVYGVENEIECRNDRDSLCEAMRDHNCNLANYSILKEDSSINGLELVTLPATLQAHQRHIEWAELCENTKPYGRGHHGHGNGMHIHADRGAIGALTLGKLLVFFNSEHNSQLLSDIAQRPIHTSNQWCRQSPVDYDKCGKSGKNPNVIGKYSALNVTTYTVECRIFNATLVPDRILKNIEFYDAAINWCKVTPVSVIEQIHCRDSFLRFVIFNRKTYPHLHEFLVKRYSPYVAYAENRRELEKKLANRTETVDALAVA